MTTDQTPNPDALSRYAGAFVMRGLIGIARAIIGVPFMIALALLMFLGGFLPMIGVTLAGLLAAVVALVRGGVVDALTCWG